MNFMSEKNELATRCCQSKKTNDNYKEQQGWDTQLRHIRQQRHIEHKSNNDRCDVTPNDNVIKNNDIGMNYHNSNTMTIRIIES